MPTRIRITPSTSTPLERNDAAAPNLSYKDSCRKEVFCSYCERKGHKEAQSRKKSRDIKQHEGIKPNTAGPQVVMVNESDLGHRKAKDKNHAR